MKNNWRINARIITTRLVYWGTLFILLVGFFGCISLLPDLEHVLSVIQAGLFPTFSNVGSFTDPLKPIHNWFVIIAWISLGSFNTFGAGYFLWHVNRG